MTNFFFYEIDMNSAIINIVQKVCHTLAKQGTMVFCFTTLFGRLLYMWKSRGPEEQQMRIWPENRKNPRDPRRSGKCAISILVYRCIWYENSRIFPMCHKNNILKDRRGPHALAVRILTKVGVFPTESFHICATLATMPSVSSPCASSYSQSEAKPWPWKTLQRKTFGCACAKRFHLRLTRKRWQKVRAGLKKGGKKCHDSKKERESRPNRPSWGRGTIFAWLKTNIQNHIQIIHNKPKFAAGKFKILKRSAKHLYLVGIRLQSGVSYVNV